MPPQSEETRWRSFRQMYRNRPWKRMRILATLLFLTLLYGYCLLYFQPQQSHESVIEYNTKHSKQYHEQQYLISLQQKERRQELTKRREEARLRRIKATQLKLANRTIVMKTTNSTSTSQQPESQQTSILRFIGAFVSFIASIGMIAAARFVVRVFAPPPPPEQPPRRSRTLRNERETRFREWARRLNRQRQDQGERPLSLSSLRLIVRGRDFTSGNDYEALLRIEEEAGPAMISLFQNMGATRDEIDRCPHRILRQGDDLLVDNVTSNDNKEPPHCAVCLERYVVEDEVRTIPCFHTFHKSCIDPWLTQKAVCPVCKHPAVA